MRKPRIDSKLAALDEDQQRQLCEWLLTPGMGYEVVKGLVFEKFDCSTSGRALSEFYREYVSPYLIERRRNAVKVAREVGGELRKSPGNFSATTIDALEQKAFELANNPMADPKDVKAIFSLVLKARDQILDRDKFEVETAERMLSDALQKKAREIATSGMSQAEKIAAMRQATFEDVDTLQASGKIQIPRA